MSLTVRRLLALLKKMPPDMEVGFLDQDSLDIQSAGVFFGIGRRSKDYKKSNLDEDFEESTNPWTLVDVIKLKGAKLDEGLASPLPSPYEEEQLFCIIGHRNENFFPSGDIKHVYNTTPTSFRLYRPEFSRLKDRVIKNNKIRESKESEN